MWVGYSLNPRILPLKPADNYLIWVENVILWQLYSLFFHSQHSRLTAQDWIQNADTSFYFLLTNIYIAYFKREFYRVSQTWKSSRISTNLKYDILAWEPSVARKQSLLYKSQPLQIKTFKPIQPNLNNWCKFF